jgi:hypothetical protein
MPSGKSYSPSFGALLDIDEVVGCAGMVRREIAIDHLVAEMPCAYSRVSVSGIDSTDSPMQISYLPAQTCAFSHYFQLICPDSVISAGTNKIWQAISRKSILDTKSAEGVFALGCFLAAYTEQSARLCIRNFTSQDMP